MNYRKGDKLLYYKKGGFHIDSMNKFVGKVVTVRSITKTDYGRPFVLIMETESGCYFDTYALRPIIPTIR